MTKARRPHFSHYFRKPPFVVAPTTLSVDLRFFDADRVALTPTSACGLNQELNRAAFGFSTTGGALFTSMRSWSTFDASNTIDMGGGTPERRDEPLCAVDIGGETPPKCKRVGAKSAPTLATEFLRPLTFLPPASAAVTFVLLLLLLLLFAAGVLLRAILVATRRGRRRSIHIRSSRDAHRILRERDFFIADSVRSND